MNCKCCNICDSNFELGCKCRLQFICLCSVQPYFGNTRLMKIENAMSVISVECYLQGAECNICCCFCIVCPWAVFILLHILFSAEQVFVLVYLCLQGCYVFLHGFPFYQIKFLSLSQKKKTL